MTHNLSERYVSPEVARLLKEHGFNEVCRCVYRMESDVSERFMEVEEIPRWDDCRGALNEQLPEGYISAPTVQAARDWLEEKYGFFISINRIIDPKGVYHYGYLILDKKCKYVGSTADYFPSNHEAINAALESCLENYI